MADNLVSKFLPTTKENKGGLVKSWVPQSTKNLFVFHMHHIISSFCFISLAKRLHFRKLLLDYKTLTLENFNFLVYQHKKKGGCLLTRYYNYVLFLYSCQVFISVAAVCVVTYTKVAISTLMREEGRKPLLWCGISTQLGSFVGAVSIFAPVNVYHVFWQGWVHYVF